MARFQEHPRERFASRRSRIVGVILAVLVASGGCSQGRKTKTASSGEASDPVSLVDAGAEPRAELRYQIADGTITESDMDFRLATLAQTTDATSLSVVPGVRLHIVSGPAVHTENGTRFEVNIEKAEPVVPDGLDSFTADDLRRSAALLEGVGGTVVIDARGFIRATELDQHGRDAELPPRLLLRLINARTTLARVALPAEPVGVGARWESKKQILVYGFEIEQLDRYTLIDRVDEEVKLEVSATQTALPQKISFPDDDLSLALEKMEANARGELVVDLNSLEADATAEGESSTVLVASSDGGASEVIQLTETFEVRMTHTTTQP